MKNGNRARAFSFIAFACLALVVFFLGTYIGRTRERYRWVGYRLTSCRYVNAMLTTNAYDRLRRKNDILITDCMMTLRSLPTWVSWFEPGTQPIANETLERDASEIAASLNRAGYLKMSQEEVLYLLKTYAGKDVVIHPSQEQIEDVRRRLNEKSP